MIAKTFPTVELMPTSVSFRIALKIKTSMKKPIAPTRRPLKKVIASINLPVFSPRSALNDSPRWLFLSAGSNVLCRDSSLRLKKNAAATTPSKPAKRIL